MKRTLLTKIFKLRKSLPYLFAGLLTGATAGYAIFYCQSCRLKFLGYIADWRASRCAGDADCLALLARSTSIVQRRAAIMQLSSLKNLSPSQCQYIAERCDPQTLIGIARTANPTIACSSQNESVPEKPEDLEADLRLALQNLQASSSDFCVQFVTAWALSHANRKFSYDDESNWYMVDESNLRKLDDRPPHFKEMIPYLKAFHAQSTVQQQKFFDLGVSNLLRFIWNSYDLQNVQAVDVFTLILKILGNLSLEGHSMLQENILDEGWLNKIAILKNSERLEWSILAEKILTNLDHDYRWGRYRAGIYLLAPNDLKEEKTEPKADIVFVHGLRGGAFRTWRQMDQKPDPVRWRQGDQKPAEWRQADLKPDPVRIDPSKTRCWPRDWLPKDLPGIRVIAVDYASFLSDWGFKCPENSQRNSIQARSKELYEKLQAAGIGERPIIWVAHSMGGLITKQLLCDLFNRYPNDPMLLNTKGIVFYSTPHFGSKTAAQSLSGRYRLLLAPSIEVQELNENSKPLLDLHQNFAALVENFQIPILSFSETLPCNLGWNIKVLLVSEISANPGFGKFYRLPCSHLNVCKPDSPNAASYRILVEFIAENVQKSFSRRIFEATYDRFAAALTGIKSF